MTESQPDLASNLSTRSKGPEPEWLEQSEACSFRFEDLVVSAHEGVRCGKRHYAIASYPGIEDAAFENIR